QGRGVHRVGRRARHVHRDPDGGDRGRRLPYPGRRRHRRRLGPRRRGARNARQGPRAASRDRARRRRGGAAMTKVLLIDNYDSFTYDLAQAFGSLGAEVSVVRADDPALATALDQMPDRLVISPGPGRPEVAGWSPALVGEAPERAI